MGTLVPWGALLIGALLVVAPSASGLHVAMQDGRVTPLRDAVWTDDDGDRHTGIRGEGVAVFSGENYDQNHPDLDHCTDLDHHRNDGMPWPFQSETLGHGSAIAGILCGDGEMSDGEHRGIAFEGQVFVYSGCIVSNSPYCQQEMDWDAHHNLRVVTDSTAGHPQVKWTMAGMPADADVLFVQGAGNSGGDGSEARTTTHDLQDDPRYLRVAAAFPDRAGVTDFSSRGDKDDPATWPHITAPGCVVSTAPPGSPVSRVNHVTRVENPPCGYDDLEPWIEDGLRTYAYVAGTSFSGPFAAGVGALMFQVHPDLSAPEARYLLTRTADPFLPAEDLDGDGEVEPEEFWDQHGYKAGYGHVNATAAVAAAHYAALHPNATLDEAVDCSTTGRAEDGSLVLNPDGGGCPTTASSRTRSTAATGPDHLPAVTALAEASLLVAVVGGGAARWQRD